MVKEISLEILRDGTPYRGIEKKDGLLILVDRGSPFSVRARRTELFRRKFKICVWYHHLTPTGEWKDHEIAWIGARPWWSYKTSSKYIMPEGLGTTGRLIYSAFYGRKGWSDLDSYIYFEVI